MFKRCSVLLTRDSTVPSWEQESNADTTAVSQRKSVTSLEQEMQKKTSSEDGKKWLEYEYTWKSTRQWFSDCISQWLVRNFREKKIYCRQLCTWRNHLRTWKPESQQDAVATSEVFVLRIRKLLINAFLSGPTGNHTDVKALDVKALNEAVRSSLLSLVGENGMAFVPLPPSK